MMLDLDVFPMFAGLLPNGAVLLELAIGDEDHLAKVQMPPSVHSRRLARETFITLDLDVLPTVAPALAGEITEFVSALRSGLIARAVQS